MVRLNHSEGRMNVLVTVSVTAILIIIGLALVTTKVIVKNKGHK